MVSVNKLINKIIIPIMVSIYLLFLIYDYKLFDNGNFESIVENHQNNAKELNKVEALILGGSNAAFGISAEQLSKDTHMNWYNASLMHEGFSDNNYHDFIKKSFISKRLQINTIVYSPINHFRDGVIDERSKYKGSINGSNDFRFRPRMSILSHLKLIVNDNYKNVLSGFPLPNEYGDFVFEEYLCQESFLQIPFEHEDIDLAASYLVSNIQDYLKFFPNSKILLSHPSEFYGSSYNKKNISLFQDALNKKIYNQLKSISMSDMERVYIANQVPIIDDRLICEGKHHLNDLGRVHRTTMVLKDLP